MGSKTLQISGFPLNICQTDVREFLERHTGEGTVFALKVRQPKVIKPRSFAYAIVQFVDRKTANDLRSRIQARMLHYGTSYLTVRDVERDIVPKPRVPMFTLPQATLHLGCLVGRDKMSVLCRLPAVDVVFGTNLRKIDFSLTWEGQRYKLGLAYESIWEIQLYRSISQYKKFLVFLVQAAPKIYMESLVASLMDFFKVSCDDQWVRTTDFTSFGFIGQSSVFCLELPYNCELPAIKEYFFYYKEVDSSFVLEAGAAYSHGLVLVPVIQPRYVNVPYRILFKINHMVQNGTLSGPTLDDEFFHLVTPHVKPINFIERALEELSYSRNCCLNPSKWLHDKYAKYHRSKYPPTSTLIALDSGLVYVHRVQITPAKVYFYGPEINVSNRVLRKYDQYVDNFIRISFVDEDCERMRSTDLISRVVLGKNTEIYKRILTTIQNGIIVGNKKFDFLAFSSSQLREHSAWMFASTDGMNASSIRSWMGDFRKIRNVAKYAARLGQSFGSSTETLSVESYEVEHIPDIGSCVKHNYIFSDGIGKISLDFAKKVAAKCNAKGFMPSAFQIRYAGYKGVVAVDPRSRVKLSLRPSMLKYESNNSSLDVLAFSKYQPCYLNRQLITLLSTLGVKDHIFEKKQLDAVKQLNRILTDPKSAAEALDLMSPSETTEVLKKMLSCGYKPEKEPFLCMMLQAFRATKLNDLRTKTRIFLRHGRAMMGCLDETGILEYGQVFVQVSLAGSGQFHNRGLYSPSGSESGYHTRIIEGKVVVTKNPCLHPGDVRVLTAVDTPELYHMVDCVVFPQKGHRPHPNECSGSDLDGDIYFVSWDPDLIPPHQVSPMDYNPAPAETLNHEVTIEEIEEYFVKYMVNDSLGVIANAHTVFADKEPSKALSEPCLELAKLFSIAVDFPKTGVPAEIPTHLHVREYPDFMEKLDRTTYESKGVIGKLFRDVKDLCLESSHIKKFTKEVAEQSYDPDMEVDGFEEYVSNAFHCKGEYDFKLGNLMDHYGIKSEAEILGGIIIKLSKTFNKYRDGEIVGHALRSLRKEARGWFAEKEGHGEDEYAKASAWYHVTYHPDYWNVFNEGYGRPHLLSFPWCVCDKLIEIKSKKMQMRIAAEALQQKMTRSFRI